LVVAVVVAACGQATESDLMAAEEKWSATGADDYTLDMEISCFCGLTGSYEVSVRDGQVAELIFWDRALPDCERDQVVLQPHDVRLRLAMESSDLHALLVAQIGRNGVDEVIEQGTGALRACERNPLRPRLGVWHHWTRLAHHDAQERGSAFSLVQEARRREAS
jgi:hypothetical protein